MIQLYHVMVHGYVRGYVSLNGVITSISFETGKCLAYECLVKNCKACGMWVSRKGTVEYDNFVREHHGSAGAMEAIGVVSSAVARKLKVGGGEAIES